MPVKRKAAAAPRTCAAIPAAFLESSAKGPADYAAVIQTAVARYNADAKAYTDGKSNDKPAFRFEYETKGSNPEDEHEYVAAQSEISYLSVGHPKPLDLAGVTPTAAIAAFIEYSETRTRFISQFNFSGYGCGLSDLEALTDFYKEFTGDTHALAPKVESESESSSSDSELDEKEETPKKAKPSPASAAAAASSMDAKEAAAMVPLVAVVFTTASDPTHPYLILDKDAKEFADAADACDWDTTDKLKYLKDDEFVAPKPFLVKTDTLLENKNGKIVGKVAACLHICDGD